MDLITMLKNAVEKQASDIFIVSGLPVSYKLNGLIQPQNDEVILPETSEQLISEAYKLADRTIDKLRDRGDDDFSISVKGLSRFRISAYKQRGTRERNEYCRKDKGTCFGDRTRRRRKINHTRLYH